MAVILSRVCPTTDHHGVERYEKSFGCIRSRPVEEKASVVAPLDEKGTMR